MARRPRFSAQIGDRSVSLGLVAILLALLGLVQGRTQDVAQAGARVGRTELSNGFLLFGDFQSLDGQLDLAVLLGEVGDARVDNLTNRETLRTLFVTVTREEQLMGTLESLMMTPTAPTTVQLGSVMYDLVYVPIRTAIFLGIAVAVLDVRLHLSGAVPAAVVLLAFIPVVWGLGMVSAAAVFTFRRGLGFVGSKSLHLSFCSMGGRVNS